MEHDSIKQTQTGFYRLPTVLSLIPVSRSSWWAGVKAGKYPAGIKIGSNTTVWRQSEIHELCERLAKGGN